MKTIKKMHIVNLIVLVSIVIACCTLFLLYNGEKEIPAKYWRYMLTAIMIAVVVYAAAFSCVISRIFIVPLTKAHLENEASDNKHLHSMMFHEVLNFIIYYCASIAARNNRNVLRVILETVFQRKDVLKGNWFEAVKVSNLYSMQRLFEYFTSEILNTTNDAGETALHIIARNLKINHHAKQSTDKEEKIIAWLILRGADVTIMNSKKQTYVDIIPSDIRELHTKNLNIALEAKKAKITKIATSKDELLKMDTIVYLRKLDINAPICQKIATLFGPRVKDILKHKVSEIYTVPGIGPVAKKHITDSLAKFELAFTPEPKKK